MLKLDTKRGLDLPLGSPPNGQQTLMPERVALLGSDYPGLKSKMLVKEGDRVTRGQALFCDRRYPEVLYVAPCSGKVTAIRLFEKTNLEAVVINECVDFIANPSKSSRDSCLPNATRTIMGKDALCEALQRHGLWPSFRTRPDDTVPKPSARPENLYVVALDNAPLAPDPQMLIDSEAEQFRTGLEALSALAERLFVCDSAAVPCPAATNLTEVRVSGPHPASLPGTLIHGVSRATNTPWIASENWYVGYQDVLAIGRLWLTGMPDFCRCITVAGTACTRPLRFTTIAGAMLGPLLTACGIDKSTQQHLRVISGAALSGRTTYPATRYLGRYDNQVVVLPEVPPEATATQTADVGLHATEAFDAAWPFSVPAVPLLRALLLQDTDQARSLGAQMLAAEDLALCSYLCAANKDYGAALEATLARMRAGH